MRSSLHNNVSRHINNGLEQSAQRLFPAYRELAAAAAATTASPTSSPAVGSNYRSADGLASTADHYYASPHRPQQLPNDDIHQNHTQVLGTAICSNLPLQIVLYYNLWFYPCWLIGMAVSLNWKFTYFELPSLSRFLLAALLAISIPFEVFRLLLGYSGNLRERVPELAGCFLFTLFPQILIVTYYLALQKLAGGGFATPFELGLNIVYAMFLLAELVWVYRAALFVVQTQSARFYEMLREGMNKDEREEKEANQWKGSSESAKTTDGGR
ncbi:hypothetical protein DFS34DRAFT_88212 [Phlyctochytrium arcticum]|nr:hypothetical protein DFS34DRAFT_88212 [Phlyctochytrium arcticum]